MIEVLLSLCVSAKARNCVFVYTLVTLLICVSPALDYMYSLNQWYI